MAVATAVSRPTPMTAPTSALRGQLVRFAVIGVASTALHLSLLAALTGSLGLQTANLVGLLVSTLANTAANRAWTFRVRGSQRLARHHLQSLAVFGVTWACSSLALEVLTLTWPHAPTGASVVVVAAANAASTVVRFAAMRSWIFRARD